MSPAKKRSSPGAEAATNGASANLEISEADALKLAELGQEMAAHELVVERQNIAYMLPFLIKRRAIVKSIPNFWPKAFINMAGTALHLQHQQDQDALSYLEDLWVERDKEEPRCFTLQFHFKPNPYFGGSVLQKEYKYLPPQVPETTTKYEGVTPAMLAFEWEQHVAPQLTKIDWKDDNHNLTKLYPRAAGEDEDDMPADPGSFFNFFEYADDPFDLGLAIATELFPDAIDFFTGNAESMDFEDDSEDDDDEDEDEIDLEKPRKKQKTG